MIHENPSITDLCPQGRFVYFDSSFEKSMLDNRNSGVHGRNGLGFINQTKHPGFFKPPP
jgi:hypothetical protein